MKFSKIVEDLQKSWFNGVYVELPEFSTNERIYVHKSGKLYHVKYWHDGTLHVIPTKLTDYEEIDDRWYIKPFHETVTDKFAEGW